jgi:hypothetical protein
MVKETFHQLDDGLIDRVFQPGADWIAEHLPFDCYAIARLCTDLSAFAWVLSQATGLIAAIQSGHPAPAAFRACLLLLGLGSIMVLRTLFQRSGRVGGGHCANPLRGGMHVHRFLCLLWLTGLFFKVATSAAELENWAALAVGVCGTAAVYFASCSDRPPMRRTLRAAREGWKLAGTR